MAVLRQLVNERSSRTVAVHPIDGARVRVGRGEGVDVFVDDPSVSRLHAELRYDGAQWTVVSLTERNPVRVDGTPVTARVLADSEVLRLGRVSLQFLHEDPRAQPTVYGADVDAVATPLAPSPAPAIVPAPAPAVRDARDVDRARTRPEPIMSGGGLGSFVLGLVLLGGLGVGGWYAYRWGQQRRSEPTAAADDAPADRTPAATRTSEAQEVVITADASEIEIDGARLRFEAGVFEPGTRIRVSRLARGELTDGLRDVLDPIEVDTAGVQPEGDVLLSIPFDGTGLGPNEQLVVVSADGDRWRRYPAHYDRADGKIVARLHHFTVVHFVVVAAGAAILWSGNKLSDRYVGETGLDHPEEYRSPGGVVVRYDVAMFGERPEGGHPQYVLDTGAAFDEALDDLARQSRFRGVDLDADDLPRVYVVDNVRAEDTPNNRDLPWGNATMAVTYPSLWGIAVEHELGPRLLRQTALHEAFHVWQIQQVGWFDADQVGWWKEASAEWAGWVAHPELTLAGNRSQFSGMTHVEQGFYGNRPLNEQYSLGDFVIALDQACPGIVVESWSSSEFIAWSGHWYAGLDKLLRRKCGLELTTVLGDYLAGHFLPAGTPRGPGSPSGAKMFPSDKYLRIHATLPAVSARAPSYRIARNDGGYTLVVNVVDRSDARLHLWLSSMPKGGRTSSPGSRNRFGLDSRDWRTGRFVSPRFSGDLHAKPGNANVGSVVLANPTDGELTTEVEMYLLSPPDDFTAEVADPKPGDTKPWVSLSWKRPPLATGERPGDDGALAKIRVYQRTASGVRQLAEHKPTTVSTSRAFDVRWIDDQATLLLRAVDKYGNESDDSNAVTLRRPEAPTVVAKPKSKPKPKPKPKPKSNGRTAKALVNWFDNCYPATGICAKESRKRCEKEGGTYFSSSMEGTCLKCPAGYDIQPPYEKVLIRSYCIKRDG